MYGLAVFGGEGGEKDTDTNKLAGWAFEQVPVCQCRQRNQDEDED